MARTEWQQKVAEARIRTAGLRAGSSQNANDRIGETVLATGAALLPMRDSIVEQKAVLHVVGEKPLSFYSLAGVESVALLIEVLGPVWEEPVPIHIGSQHLKAKGPSPERDVAVAEIAADEDVAPF